MKKMLRFFNDLLKIAHNFTFFDKNIPYCTQMRQLVNKKCDNKNTTDTYFS